MLGNLRSEVLLGLPEYEVTALEESAGQGQISLRFTGKIVCPDCGGAKLRRKDRRLRHPRHESWGVRHCVLALETYKMDSGSSFWQRFPGFNPARVRLNHSGEVFVKSTLTASAGAD